MTPALHLRPRGRGVPCWLVRVRGRSMQPTLADGDLLLVRARGRAGPAPGRLLVVRWPGPLPVAVKRLVHRGTDGWWVQRDNPREGVDSWSAGAVPDEGVVAVVLCRLWPRPGRIPPPP